MTVHRTPKDRGHPFSRIDNEAVRDRGLSLKARGLLAQILSMADEWVLSFSGMLSLQEKDGEDSVRAAWRELEAMGYLRKRERGRNAQGRLQGVEYEVFERPQEGHPPRSGLPCVDKPRVAHPRAGNPAVRTTNAEAKNNELGLTTKVELEGSRSIINEKGKQPGTAGDAGAAEQDLCQALGRADVTSATGAPFPLQGEVFLACREVVDLAMAKNLELIRAMHWSRLDELVRGNRSFEDAFGQDPSIAWTREQDGYLEEMASFCREQWPDSELSECIGALIRGAFMRRVKVFQILKYWVIHGGCKVSLRPFLTLAGGGRDGQKRFDFLKEVAATMRRNEMKGASVPETPSSGCSAGNGSDGLRLENVLT